jgi:hypothetical protein
MQLLKNLNRTIYILFFIGAFLLFFTISAKAHTITSNINSAKPNQQITFSGNLTFDGSAGTATAYINYGDGTPEKIIFITLPGSPFSYAYSSTHNYLKHGTYTVMVRAVITSGAAISTGPNPAIMIQGVKKGFEISRIRLYFENNRPEITIKRNQKPPKLFVKIDYSGERHLKGYWEIDGTRRSYVFKYLTKGPSVTLQYPDVPPIPTFKYGTHNVRFVITDPAMDINFPYGIYFVASDEKEELAAILLLQPAEGEEIVYEPLIFKFKPVSKASVYLVSIFSVANEKRIFAAYTRQGEYQLRLNILKSRMKPGDTYIWNVVGFNDNNEVIAESLPSAFSFNQETELLP